LYTSADVDIFSQLGIVSLPGLSSVKMHITYLQNIYSDY